MTQAPPPVGHGDPHPTPEVNVLTAELYTLHQALTNLHTTHAGSTTHTGSKVVIYTDSLSSLHLLSRHTASSTTLVHIIQRALLHFTSGGWEITLQVVPSHSGIQGSEVTNTTAKT